jgi:predicted dehydrogenase
MNKQGQLKRIGMGIVGAGFVGPHHLDAVRRLGFVEIVAVAGSTEESGRRKAEQLAARKGYGSYEALIADPEVEVVHVATPNHLHYPVIAEALARGKHVISDKPLAATAAQASQLADQAKRANVVTAVTFNYRGNPLVQQARHAIARGDIGKPAFLHGYYLQDWLLKDTDYSWRLEPEKGGASSALGDIGSHWCDLAQHMTGLRITHVLGDITTVISQRKKPRVSREAFQTSAGAADLETVNVAVEDLASVLVKFDNGAKGCFTAGQVCAGHKNDLVLEVCGSKASVCWRQEHQNELWIGHRDKANELLLKDPSLLDSDVRGYAHLPGGHQEAWADAFCNLMRDIYGFIAAGKRPESGQSYVFASFEEAARVNRIVEAILESAKNGGAWVKV